MGYGGLIVVDGREIEYGGIVKCNGHNDNSTVAEYVALINGILRVKVLFPNMTNVSVFGDSKCIIDTLNRQRLPKSKTIIPYHELLVELLRGLEARFTWVPETQNKRADRISKVYNHPLPGMGLNTNTP